MEREYITYFYQAEIPIVDRYLEPNRIATVSTTFDKAPNFLLNGPLFKGTPVRAQAVLGERRSEIIDNIYFIGDRSSFSLPIVNITFAEEKIFNYENGAFVAGKKYDEWSASKDVDTKVNHHSDANWKNNRLNIPATLTYLDIGKSLADSHGKKVDIRIHGGASRTFRNKSIRIYPRKEYSSKGIKVDLFNDHELLNFSRVIFRNSGNAASSDYMRDAVMQKAFSDLNFGTQRYRPFSIFINGEYYGILNARDRLDHRYIEHRFNLPNRNLDILKLNQTVERGDAKNWQNFLEFLKRKDKGIDAIRLIQHALDLMGFQELNFGSLNQFKEIQQYIDVSNYVDYHTAEIFIGNTDWPGNNIRYWRYKGTEKFPLTETGFTDGRWRWLMYDTDFGGSGRDKHKHNTLRFATEAGNKGWPNPDWSTFVLRTLLENPEFKTRFITRFSDLLNSTFLPNRMEAIIRDAEKGIEKEMPRHIERWKTPKSMKHWRNSVNNLVNFFHERPKYQWQHLEEFFNLEGRYQVNVAMALTNSSAEQRDDLRNNPGDDFGRIQLNTLTLGEPKPENPDVTYTNLALPWQGDYFKKLPLVVEAIPAEGYQFSHWEAEGITLTEEEQKSLKLRLQPERDLQLRAVVIEAKGK